MEGNGKKIHKKNIKDSFIHKQLEIMGHGWNKFAVIMLILFGGCERTLVPKRGIEKGKKLVKYLTRDPQEIILKCRDRQRQRYTSNSFEWHPNC